MEIFDPDLVADPVKTPKVNVDKTFLVNGSTVAPVGLAPEISTVSDGPLGANVAGELPDFKAEFEILNEKSNKIVSFAEVEHQLITGKAVSQESALMVEQILGGFISTESINIKSFTKNPSNVNYKKTLSFVKERIALESSELRNTLKELVSEYINSKVKTINTYCYENADNLKRAIEITYDDKSAELEKIADSANRVIMINDNMQDLYFVNLVTLQDKEIDSAEDKFKPVICGLSALGRIAYKKSLYYLLYLMKNEKEIEAYFDNEACELECFNMDLTLTYIDISDLFENGVVLDYVNNLFEQVTDESSVFNKTLNDLVSSLNETNEADTNAWLLINKNSLITVLSALHRLDTLRILIPLFIEAFSEVTDEVAKIV